MRKNDKLVMGFICVIAFVIVSLPLFSSTLFAVEGHDTFFHTQRIWSIKQGLESGQFPVRIYTEIYDGYGYGSSLFYPELFLYIPAVLCILGLPLTLSYNLFLLLINAVTLVLAWYSFSKITDSVEIGLTAALLYELCSYRMLDIFTRGSMGEVLALVFCPLALCGLHLIAKGENHKWWILTLAFSGLLQSHILSFILMIIVAAGYVIIRCKAFFNVKAILALVLAAGTAILLNGWFLLPFLEASKLNVIAMLGTNGFWVTDATLAQLFDVLLLNAGGAESFNGLAADVLPKTPGITLIAGSIIAVFVLILYGEKMKNCRKQLVAYLAAGAFFSWMVTNLFPWKFIEKIDVLNSFFSKYQFIWRFNMLAVLFLSIAAAYGIYYFFVQDAVDKYKSLVIVGLVLCGFSLIFVNQYIKQASQFGNEEVIQKGYMDKLYVVPGFAYGSRDAITSNFTDAIFTDVDQKECEISFCFNTATGAYTSEEADSPYIEVPITYYPGYKGLLNGKEAKCECSIWGVIRIWIPEKCTEGVVQVFFDEPALWTTANVISCITGIGFLTYIILQKKKVILEDNK